MTNMLTSIAEALRRRRNTSATIDELQRLTDAELHDIGITRGNIHNIAHGILDIHRAVRGANSANDAYTLLAAREAEFDAAEVDVAMAKARKEVQ